MNNIIVWIVISAASIVWGILNNEAGYTDFSKHNSYFKFLELYRHSINYFITLVIAYYIVSIRWIYLSQGGSLTFGDFIMGVIFIIGISGWLPYFIKNITEGINIIINRILK